MDIEQKQSPNFNARKGCLHPSLIVLHGTFTKNAAEAEAVYLDPKTELSCHYMVDTDGTITQYVADKHRAWHAGKSYWNGIEDVNSHSIGIEIQNGGHERGSPAYPKDQIAAVVYLCRALTSLHCIKPQNILGHSDIAPGRKIDPGEHFPWEALARGGVGIWPEKLKTSSEDVGIISCLKEIGYNPNVEDVALVREFQRRYEPDIFKHGQQGQATQKTHDLANRLLQFIKQS